MNSPLQVEQPAGTSNRDSVATAPDRGRSSAEHATSAAVTARLQAAVVALAPAVMLAGFLYHPHIGDPVDADFLSRLGAAVSADPTRWAVAHLMIALGSGLVTLAFLAIQSGLRDVGEGRWGSFGVPFVVIGSTMYALLPAMEFAPLAAAMSGADPAAAQAAIFPWFVPILLTSAVIFVVGAVGFAIGISRSRLLGPGLTRIVAGLIVVMAASRLVPLSAIQLHLQGVAGVAAMWPLAYAMWKRPDARTVR